MYTHNHAHSHTARTANSRIVVDAYGAGSCVTASYLAGRSCYEVKDADDPMKQIEVPADRVIRLREEGDGFAKGDDVRSKKVQSGTIVNFSFLFGFWFFLFILFCFNPPRRGKRREENGRRGKEMVAPKR